MNLGGSTGTCWNATSRWRGWTPARHPLVLRDKSERRRVIGWAEGLDEHPRDHVPWMGLLEVHQQEQQLVSTPGTARLDGLQPVRSH